MAIYFKQKCEKQFKTMAIVSQFIEVGEFKRRLLENCRGTDIDLVVSNAQTNEEYTDNSQLIPRYTSVVVRRVAGDWRQYRAKARGYNSDNSAAKLSTNPEESEWGKECGSLELREPPPEYVCHRCNKSGHFIQQCPTNDDPTYDGKRFRRATGIPKSMLKITSEGTYRLPGGALGILQPDEAAFEKAIQGIPTLAHETAVSIFPADLFCSICNKIMKEASLCSKCCFGSFCDECIRDHIINKSQCVCGSRDVLADDLVSNLTLRRTINELQESASTSSHQKAGSVVQLQGMQSSTPVLEKVPSPAISSSQVETKHPAPADKCSPEDANGVKAVVAPDAILESGTKNNSKSPEMSPVIKGNAAKSPIASQAKNKKKRPRPPEELGGVNGSMPITGSGYNNCFGSAMQHMPLDPFLGAAAYGSGLPPVSDPFMNWHYFNMMSPAQREPVALSHGYERTNMVSPPILHREEEFAQRRVDVRGRSDMEGPPKRELREYSQRLVASRERRRDQREWNAIYVPTVVSKDNS